jgi:hypothetical protein
MEHRISHPLSNNQNTLLKMLGEELGEKPSKSSRQNKQVASSQAQPKVHLQPAFADT